MAAPAKAAVVPKTHADKVAAAIAALNKKDTDKLRPVREVKAKIGWGSALVWQTGVVFLLFLAWNIFEAYNRADEVLPAAIGGSDGPKSPPPSQNASFVPPTPPSNTGTSQGCDDHVITSTESLIRPSQKIVDRPQGFKFKTNGHTVLISVVRNGVKQPGVRVGPGQSFKSQGGGFQDSDKSGFYITLVDETSATVSFCPKP